MFHLDVDTLRIIYSYDNTYRIIYSNCLKSISKKYCKIFINRKNYKYCKVCKTFILDTFQHFNTNKHIKNAIDFSYNNILNLFALTTSGH